MNFISVDGILKLQELEGLRLQPYKDAGGKWTIGFGHLIKPGEEYLMNGITISQAHDLFVNDLVPFVNRINQYVTVPLTQPQFDALVMWDFNTGAANESQLIKMINARSPISEITDWWSNHYTTASGNFVQGVKNRRVYEASLFAGSSTSPIGVGELVIGSLVVYAIYKAFQ